MTRRRAPRPPRDKMWIGILLVTATVVGSMYFVYDSSPSASKLISDKVMSVLPGFNKDGTAVVVPPFDIVADSKVPAVSFVTELASFQPDGYAVPSVKSRGVATTHVSWTCSNINLSPSPSLGLLSDIGNTSSVIIQSYGAGQAMTAIQSYRDGLNSCSGRDGSVKVSGTLAGVIDATGFKYSVSTTKQRSAYHVAVWARGDTIIAVAAPSVDALNSLVQAYDGRATSLLSVTGCLSLNESEADSTRSPYYQPASYTGWERGRTVTIPSSYAGVRPGAISTANGASGSGYRIGDVNSNPDQVVDLLGALSVPEGPLPANFPTTLPIDPLTKPDSPASPPVAPADSTVIPERVADPDGPGCGWAWAGQSAPLFDDSTEKARVDALVADAEKILVENYTNYLVSYSSWRDASASLSPQISAWNEYAARYNSVISSWADLNAQRATYRTALDAYYAEIAARNDFIKRQNLATIKYDTDVATCAGDHTNPTPSPSPSPSPSPKPAPKPSPSASPVASTSSTPSPSPSPTPAPLVCPPVKPNIISQEIPSIPSPPTKPNVPLPASWTDIP